MQAQSAATYQGKQAVAATPTILDPSIVYHGLHAEEFRRSDLRLIITPDSEKPGMAPYSYTVYVGKDKEVTHDGITTIRHGKKIGSASGIVDTSGPTPKNLAPEIIKKLKRGVYTLVLKSGPNVRKTEFQVNFRSATYTPIVDAFIPMEDTPGEIDIDVEPGGNHAAFSEPPRYVISCNSQPPTDTTERQIFSGA